MTALATARLTLRPPAMEDFDGFAGFLASPRARFVGGPGQGRDASWRAFAHLAGMWHLRGYGPFCVLLEGETIGMAGPWHPVGTPEPEIAYSLWSADHEGRGLMAEAVAETVRYGWRDARLPSLVSYIDPGNRRSVALALRLGAARDRGAEPSEPGIHVYRYPAPTAHREAAE